ncbi:MAG TPA: WD40 repeat domain-containing protein [Fimbriimonadaceae bacterium]|nr:WD40 repeat domain-containing protein [Fimbriimonadaceae bacterium]
MRHLAAALLLLHFASAGDGSFQEIGRGKAMTGDVEGVAVSDSGRYAATFCQGVFQVVDTSGGFYDEWEFQLPISGVTFSGEKAYIFKENGTVEVRDCKAAKFLTREKVPARATYPKVGSSGAKFYYVGPQPKGDADQGLACIDSASGKVDFYLPNLGTAGLYGVTADGKKVVAVEGKPGGDSGNVALKLKLYDVATKSTKTLKATKSVGEVGSFISSCHFSPDGKTILACLNTSEEDGSGYSELISFGVQDGKPIRSSKIPEGLVGEVAFLPNGNTVIFQNLQNLICYDLERSSVLFSTSVGSPSTTPLKVSANGQVLALPSGKQIWLWKIQPK